LVDTSFRDLKGIQKTNMDISFGNCNIDSFEGLDINNLNILDKSTQHAFFFNTSFSSLHGINRITLQSILIEFFSRFGNLYALAKLTSKGMNLLNDCVNPEVNNANNPLEFVRENLHRVYPEEFCQRVVLNEDMKRKGVNYFVYILNENGIEYPGYHIWNDDKDPKGVGMELWVYALNLEEKLFIPEKIDKLLKFYEQNPAELALEYRSNPKSLTKDQIERLIHEADLNTAKILEDDKYSNLPPNDPVIDQISQKFTIRTKNGIILL